jgi:serine/threonine protein kinase
VLVFALWSPAVQLAFDAGTVLDYCDPLLGLALGSGGTLIGGIWSDRRERMRLRELFAADVESVVEQVLRPSGAQPLAPTAIIAGYRIEEVVGRGGMGVVYRASQVALGRRVAVKLIAPEHYRDRDLRERFKSESRMAASIDHVNVIPVYEAGEDDGLLFIAMRLVRGIDLAQLIVRQGPLDPTRALTLLAQLAGALDAAHALGLVHRDVKPANALVTFDVPEHLYLTDFGVATRVGVGVGGGTDGGAQWVGTLDYLAPEQAQGEAVDARADVYALACVLHQCLTGETPFPRESKSAKLWAHVNAPPPSLSQLAPHLPRALDGVIACGMAKDPADRFASAGALAHALAAALGVSIVLGSSADAIVSDSGRTKPTPPVERTVISE